MLYLAEKINDCHFLGEIMLGEIMRKTRSSLSFSLITLLWLVFSTNSLFAAPRADVDIDDDGLIEIYTLSDLDNMRRHLDGSAFSDGADNVANQNGCFGDASGATVCNGYELMNDLDFNTDGSTPDSVNNSLTPGDQFYNGGLGWEPIGTRTPKAPFTAIFEGNYFTLHNLNINRSAQDYIGLFGYVKWSEIRHLQLHSVYIRSNYYAGAVAGSMSISNLHQLGIKANIFGRDVSGGVVGNISVCMSSQLDVEVIVVNLLSHVGGSFGQTDCGIQNSGVKGRFSFVESDNLRVGGLVGVSRFGTPRIRHSFAVPLPWDSFVFLEEKGRGGVIGFTTLEDHLSDIYWGSEESQAIPHAVARPATNPAGTTKLSDAQLRCPTAPNADCLGATGIYANWDPAIWDFGTSSDLPRLIWAMDPDGDGRVNGRIDVNGECDNLTAFECQLGDNDDDNDGILDNVEDANQNGIVDAGETSPRNADSDGDGLSDGDEINLYGTDPLNTDSDNDGVNDDKDAYPTDPNGDVDLDDDGLIELDSLEGLDAMRYALDGAGLRFAHMTAADSRGCNGDDSGVTACNGYELMSDLDFDTNSDGVMDASDTYWDGSEGWQPIGDLSNPFTAQFNGNHFRLQNLFINRPSQDYVGLFGYLDGANISALGISGGLSQIIGQDNVGGLAGSAFNGNISNVFVFSNVQGRTSVGGLVGVAVGPILASFSSGQVTGANEVGGIAGRLGRAGANFGVHNLYSAAAVTANGSGAGGLFGVIDLSFGQIDVTRSYARGLVTAAGNSGGLVGELASSFGSASYNIDLAHWDLSGHADAIGSNLPFGGVLSGNRLGLTSAEMTCPTGPDDTVCKSGETLYSGWSNSVWDFGTTNQYPTLIFNGVAYHDTDNDLIFDTVDEDDDGDGISDLNEASLGTDPLDTDTDDDGLNDGFEDANQNGQVDSGETNPTLADTDSDNLEDGADAFPLIANRDLDTDDDGLIELDSLAGLDAMRYALNGAGLRLAHMTAADSTGCNGVADGSSPCNGYELMNDLDFDTNSDGAMDANDTYWNGDEGWQPIGDSSNPFTARFNGNHFRIRNLFINRPSQNYVGLFGALDASNISALGISGGLAQIVGQDNVGGLAGSTFNGNISNVFVFANVQGRTSIGGLVGVTGGPISESFSSGQVTGANEVGGISGRLSRFGVNLSLHNLYSAAEVTATRFDTGGLFGVINLSFGQIDVTRSYARGLVTTVGNSGGLVGKLESVAGSAVYNIDLSHWDLSGHADAIGSNAPFNTTLSGNRLGLTSAEMTCPTGPDDTVCKSGETLYSSWDNSIWDFGTATQYPTLIFNGIAYHDTDNDGVLDPFDDDDDGDGFSDVDEGVCGTDSLDALSVPTDTDSDGLCDNGVDDDDDNDTYLDVNDAFPLDATEWLDTDLDGTGNNADTDDDNDTFSDVDEGVCGTDSLDVLSVPTDTDSDGLCDAGVDNDDDNDGVDDVNDAFPLDPSESLDTDSDGTGNNADTDDDNDTFSDIDEGICGTDSLDVNSVPADTDSDGLCDNGLDMDDDNDSFLDINDAFPLDPTEWLDTDSDSIGNNADTDDDDDTFSDIDEGVCGTDPLDVLSVPTDTDSDGLCDNGVDDDDDNDGVDDTNDAFPLDATESVDTDGDGTGNNADTDDDNDGTPDASDAFPLDASEDTDTDADGIGNNADTDDDNDTFSDLDEGVCGSDALDVLSVPTDTDSDGLCDNGVDLDDDNDNFLDINDAFPLDATEWLDTDLDGIGNNADTDDDNDTFSDIDEGVCGTNPLSAASVPVDSDGDGLCDNGVDSDDDNDGTPDAMDAFPLDPSESLDTDNDGIGNNADTDDDGDNYSDIDEGVCGTDPLNAASIPFDLDRDGLCDNGVDNDDDNDGTPDALDAFPNNPAENTDSDGDGTGDNADIDDDNDGTPDIADAFPFDPNESMDTDGDGVGNNADTDDDNDGTPDASDDLPLDPTETVDSDGDGIGDNADTDDDNDGTPDSTDAFPNDPNEDTDTDGDGTGDNADTDDDNDGVADSNDAFPLDPNRSETSGGGGSWNLLGILMLLGFTLRRKYYH